MKKQIRHNKIKNTGIIFEVLVRQITSDILNESKNSSDAMRVIRRYFNKNTELRKELQLYQELLKKKFANELRASSFVDIIVNAQRQLNGNNLKHEKYNIIKEIRDIFSIDDLFSSKIENYAVYASIYKLFEYSDILSEVSNAETLVQAKYTIIEFLYKGETSKNKTSPLIKELENQDSTTKLITQKLIIEKFNKKYGKKLNTNQAGLIKDYIHNVSSDKTLMTITHKHISKIITEIASLIKKIPDETIKIKINQISKQLKEISNKKKIRDNHIVAILRVYELIEEINKHIEKHGCDDKKKILKENK